MGRTQEITGCLAGQIMRIGPARITAGDGYVHVYLTGDIGVLIEAETGWFAVSADGPCPVILTPDKRRRVPMKIEIKKSAAPPADSRVTQQAAAGGTPAEGPALPLAGPSEPPLLLLGPGGDFRRPLTGEECEL